MTASPDTKRVVLCADDFGMNHSVDDGILDLARLNRLSAASCLVDGPSFSTNTQALKLSPLQTGLHLNFTEPLGAQGLYLPLTVLMRRAFLYQLDVARVRAQILHQLDRFEDEMGRRPDFIDGHQHIHQFPQIRTELLFELVRRYGQRRPWLRYTGARGQAGIPLGLRLKARIIQMLGARRFSQLARRDGFDLNNRFAGVYDFQGGHGAYARLLAVWLRQMRSGDLLMCHPARGIEAGDPLGAQRLAEYQVLAGDDAGRWFADHGIALEARADDRLA